MGVPFVGFADGQKVDDAGWRTSGISARSSLVRRHAEDRVFGQQLHQPVHVASKAVM
jgi:hypothetical protein